MPPISNTKPQTRGDAICRKLDQISAGFRALGFRAFPIEDASQTIREQAQLIHILQTSHPYTEGFEKGYQAAFATGLTGEESV